MLLRDSIFLLLLFTFIGVQSNDFSVSFQKKPFPIFENEDFSLTISLNETKFPFYSAIIFSFKLDGFEKQRSIINPGFQTFLSEPINGLYFTIQSFVSSRNESLTLQMKFHRPSDKNTVDIYYIPSKNKTIRRFLLKNFSNNDDFFLKSIKIKLHLHWNLKLTQKTVDHYEGGLIEGQRGILSCEAQGGHPKAKAVLLGLENLQVYSTDFNHKRNIHTATIEGKITDHKSIIGCSADRDAIYEGLNILHHPTDVIIQPSIANGFVANGTELVCSSVDGHPRPNHRWYFEAGPSNATNFYDIDNERGILFIKPVAPLGSQWSFTCKAWNTIANSVDKGVSLSVSFTIGVKPIPIAIIMCSLLGAAIILTIIVTIIWLWRRRQMLLTMRKKLESGVSITELKHVSVKEGYTSSNISSCPPLYSFGPVDKV